MSVVEYYEPTNSIWVWADTSADYGTFANYCLGHFGYVYKNDVEQTMFNGYTCGEYIANLYYEVFVPYDPDADYTVEVNSDVELRHQGANGWGYDDYSNYNLWANGDPVYFPGYFGFSGPGPEVEISGSDIFLGTVYGLFTEGGGVGPPDHVKVVSDTGNSEHDRDCGFPDRRITVQLVDSNGRRAVALASRVSVRERYFTAGFPTTEVSCIWSTCTNQCASPTTSHQSEAGGKFTDHLFAGCPPPPFPTSCGQPEFVNKWIWCPRGRPEKILAINVYEVTSQHVLINGQTQYSAGIELR
ncbi:MAG TPA: hypothetical protein VJT71_05870 [Pyrinomonadaceae bacterium]|nr:hypothetical protein [Pyrinomonadaceae bacterium]